MPVYGPPQHSSTGYSDNRGTSQRYAAPQHSSGGGYTDNPPSPAGGSSSPPGAVGGGGGGTYPAPQPRDAREYDNNHHDNNDDDDEEEEEEDDYNYDNPTRPDDPKRDGDRPGGREFKYSTANMESTSKWRRVCCLLLMFLICLAIMILISYYINKLFFSETSDKYPHIPERYGNETFAEFSGYVNKICSVGQNDNGATCRDVCEPQFASCCDPFDELRLYNMTIDGKTAKDIQEFNGTVRTTSNSTVDLSNCTIDVELVGCTSYAKCAVTKDSTIDPAPSGLPSYCSMTQLSSDPGACVQICQSVDCCFTPGKDNCMMSKFDSCLDYAPCQNLRRDSKVPSAPPTIDEICYLQYPSCNKACEVAQCCSTDSASGGCLDTDFISCLTYASCTGVTTTNVTLKPQFSVVPRPPTDFFVSCLISSTNKVPGATYPAVNRSCFDYCQEPEIQCCWSTDAGQNCFASDPLGCLAWQAQCQYLLSS